jgi:hypothetical protein
MKDENWFWEAVCWVIKTIGKIFLLCVYGLLRIGEIIIGQFAKWLKDIID